MNDQEQSDRESMLKVIKTSEERRRKWEEEGERPLWKNLSMVGALGWLIVVPTILGVFVGRWLDGKAPISFLWVGPLPRSVM